MRLNREPFAACRSESIDYAVLEKHADFFRDFRGDTIHPSTVDLIDQLGCRDRFDATVTEDDGARETVTFKLPRVLTA